jgi:hypothetical protein
MLTFSELSGYQGGRSLRPTASTCRQSSAAKPQTHVPDFRSPFTNRLTTTRSTWTVPLSPATGHLPFLSLFSYPSTRCPGFLLRMTPHTPSLDSRASKHLHTTIYICLGQRVMPATPEFTAAPLIPSPIPSTERQPAENKSIDPIRLCDGLRAKRNNRTRGLMDVSVDEDSAVPSVVAA